MGVPDGGYVPAGTPSSTFLAPFLPRMNSANEVCATSQAASQHTCGEVRTGRIPDRDAREHRHHDQVHRAERELTTDLAMTAHYIYARGVDQMGTSTTTRSPARPPAGVRSKSTASPGRRRRCNTNYTNVDNIFGTGVYPSAPLPTFGQFTEAAPPFQAQLAVKLLF